MREPVVRDALTGLVRSFQPVSGARANAWDALQENRRRADDRRQAAVALARAQARRRPG